ncbi:TPA: hypothetical protein OT801_003743 [Morganella morganii]|uniref:P-type conjugative transfer protein TrbJ n=1 Tax=Proteus mirabilis TaxID=584 RepID=A0AAN1EXK3_PROMI|nr:MULTISPECIES: hypothetical protein [Enterobacterales]ECK3796615.1 hypothetical protein [Salmonella enterica]ECM0800554.1 hypothetical protein [Salmonella enterica subsp. enterica serovar Enteritidis]EFP7242557.1 hypothetical protein [Shigella flexneri]EFT9560159.1 hypothetical protein [Salmonella enterica subsp. enterica]EJR0218706.1 hypothetical protein [Klebsiella pneumoniae]EKU4289523.1 hypothetical protein [Morganella morganii]MJC96372.1 hypothetical protein [Salmonella enterica subsp
MKKILIAGVFAISTFTTLNSFAWHGVATEGTQWLNNLQLVKQVEEQMRTVKNQIQDLQRLPSDVLNMGSNKLKVLETFNDLKRIYQEGQNIAQAGRDVAKYYKDMGNIDIADALKNGNYPQLFNQWSHQNHDTVKGILEQNKLSMDWFNDRQGEVAGYNSMLNSADGTVSALQAAGKIANAQLDSLSQLGQLQMAQNNLLASQAAVQQSEKDAERADTIRRSEMNVIINSDNNTAADFLKRD